MLIAANTTLAAAAGTVAAMLLAWSLFKKPDLTMALNGALAGLVGITANCDSVTNIESIIIGVVVGDTTIEAQNIPKRRKNSEKLPMVPA